MQQKQFFFAKIPTLWQRIDISYFLGNFSKLLSFIRGYAQTTWTVRGRGVVHVVCAWPLSRSFQTIVFFFQASCLLIKSHKCKQKNHKAFSHPLYLHYYELWGAENFFGNRKLQKTWLVTLSGPLAAILKFTQKCKQTAVSQKLSEIKNFFQDIFCISWGT